MTDTTKAPVREPTFTTDEHGEEIARVTLTNGKVATLAKADWLKLQTDGVSPNWQFHKSGGARYVRTSETEPLTIARLILGAGPREIVRYRTSDRLDLRRSNLWLSAQPRRRTSGWKRQKTATALAA